MKKIRFKGHFFWGFIYLLIITILIEPLALVLIFIVTFIGIFPDLDMKLYKNSHRWVWFHSLLFPILAFIFYPNILTLLILLAIGFHLFLDVFWSAVQGKKRTGYYTICIIPSYTWNFIFFKIKTHSVRLNANKSTIWLLLNFMISFLFIYYYIEYVVM